MARRSPTAGAASTSACKGWARTASATSGSTMHAKGRNPKRWKPPGAANGCPRHSPPRPRRRPEPPAPETSMHLSHADHGSRPPRVDIPRDYNAAHDLLQRNAARSGKVAFIDAASGAQLTFGDLSAQAHRFADALR